MPSASAPSLRRVEQGRLRARDRDWRGSLDQSSRRETVRQIARTGDPDRYAAALFAPADARDALFALYACNVELARIAEQVTEPELGRIRLQWWRDNLASAAAGERTGHPVADALGEALRSHRIVLERVTPLIEAREFDLEPSSMVDGQSLENYLRDTAGTLFAVAAEMLGGRSERANEASASSGLAYGLTGLMRALPIHAAAGRLYLPADVLARHGLAPEALLSSAANERLRLVLGELRDLAKSALDQALPLVASLGTRTRWAFLPLALVKPYLAALELTASDPLRRIADINPLYRFWRLATWRYRS